MKRILTSVFFTISTLSFGQTLMIVHKSDGSTEQLPVSAIDSINFTLPLPATMNIHRTGENFQTFALSATDSVTHSIQQLGCDGAPTVTDIDGNTYNTVQIGNQCWTKENLKTSKYADGSVIPNVTSDAVWGNLSTPAWCNFENSPANDAIYGKLYNWYVMADPRKVCPVGWHVPSYAEWLTLTDFLGGDAVAGGKMKTTSGWTTPNTGATNQSGFSGLPCGDRANQDGKFFALGNYGLWWSSSEYDTSNAWYRSIYHLNTYAYNYGTNKEDGLSVRCLRD